MPERFQKCQRDHASFKSDDIVETSGNSAGARRIRSERKANEPASHCHRGPELDPPGI